MYYHLCIKESLQVFLPDPTLLVSLDVTVEGYHHTPRQPPRHEAVAPGADPRMCVEIQDGELSPSS